jgi:hypothetical protein
MSDLVGLPGTSSGGAWNVSPLPSSMPSDESISLPGIAGLGGGLASSVSAAPTGNDTNIWDILTDQSAMGTGYENSNAAASAIGTANGTSNANSITNPGGSNPGSTGTGTSNAGSGFSSIWASITSNMYNIFAVVLGIVFVIIGASSMAKSAGMSALPVE